MLVKNQVYKPAIQIVFDVFQEGFSPATLIFGGCFVVWGFSKI